MSNSKAEVCGFKKLHGDNVARARIFFGLLWLTAGLLIFPAPAFSATGDVLSSFPSPGSESFGLAWDGSNLWHADSGTDVIYEVSTTGAILSSFPAPPGANAHGLAWDGNNLWLADNNTDTIYELTTAGAIVSSFPAPGTNPRGLTWDGTNLWIADNSTDTIFEVTTSGTIVSSFPSPDANPQGLTWDGSNLWLADESVDRIVRLTSTGVVLSSFSTPGPNPRGLAWDGTNFWHADLSTDTIYELDGSANLSGMYYWQDDSGTPVAGFTTDSTGCGSEERDIYLVTLMSSSGFNCTNFRHEGRAAVPQNLWLIIKDTAYAVATDVTGIDFSLDFLSDTAGPVTARYELGYAQGGVFTSWGFVDEGPISAEALYVTDLSSISGTAPAGSNLALRIVDVAPSPGDMRMFTGSSTNGGILNVNEGVAAICPGSVVTNTSDSPAGGSLRACIDFANGAPGTTIRFNIPGPGNRSAGPDRWWGISPATPLPTITAAGTVIDATTQTANQGDTNSRGPEVEIDGAGAGAGANGLVLGTTAGGSTIRGLAIGNFSDNGILLQGDSNIVAGNYLGLSADGDTIAANNPGATNFRGGIRVESASNRIGGAVSADRNVASGNGIAGIELFGAGATSNQVYGNYAGVDATGTLARPNSQEGVDLELSSNNIIGGPLPGQRNILSGNGSDGIEIDGGDANVIQGNYIGTDVTGAILIPNTRDGIDINENSGDGSTGTLVGGTGPNEGNLIRGNMFYGVSIRDIPVVGNTILGNRIYGNVLLDLDVNDDGLTSNDPLDVDVGPNNLLNYPVIVAAPESSGSITVYFELDVPAGDYRIEFFANPSGAHGTGNGGGEVFAAATTVTHGGAGVELFAYAFAGSAGDIITATATEEIAGPAYNSTSEFSAAFTATSITPFSARWPLDETSGIVAADVDAGNDGTYLNGVLLNQPAACADTGNATYFDGVDDLVEVADVPDYQMDEGTVSFWANANALPGTQQGLFSKDSTDLDTGGHLTITIQPGGSVQTRLQSTTTSMFVSSAPIAAGTWFHVAFSWGPDGMALYLDGAAPATDPYVGGLGTTSGGIGNFEPIAFGATTVNSDDFLVTPTTNFFAGYMDDVRINNRALTLAEIQTLANCTPRLDIVKRAFWIDGTPIPTGATIPSGVEFKYLLYVNNPNPVSTDVTVRDVLNPAFQFQTGTLQVDTSVGRCAGATCTAAEEQAIFTAVNGSAFQTDATGDDVASYTGASASVDAGNGNVGNPQLDINANAVWAILFSVKMP